MAPTVPIVVVQPRAADETAVAARAAAELVAKGPVAARAVAATFGLKQVARTAEEPNRRAMFFGTSRGFFFFCTVDAKG